MPRYIATAGIQIRSAARKQYIAERQHQATVRDLGLHVIDLSLQIIGRALCIRGGQACRLGLPLLIVRIGLRHIGPTLGHIGTAVGAVGFLGARLQAHRFALLGESLALIDRQFAFRLGPGDRDLPIGHEFKMGRERRVGLRLLGGGDGNIGLIHRQRCPAPQLWIGLQLRQSARRLRALSDSTGALAQALSNTMEVAAATRP